MPSPKAPDGVLRVAVTLTVPRDGKPLKAVTGYVDVLFRLDDSVVTPQPASGEPRLAPSPTRIRRGPQRSIPDAGLATAPGR